jgi:membrane fusion protein, peptide pheromone/bacteriocin exporter
MKSTQERLGFYGGAYALGGAESFLAKQGRSRPYVYWTALISGIAALISLPLVRVDLTVQERGRVRPAAERCAIVAGTSGFIASIQAHDNDLVQAGDTLFVLDAQGLQAKIDFNRSQTALVEKELADLNYLLDCADTQQAVSVSALQSAKCISEYQKFDTECRHADLRMARTERELRRTQQLLADRAVASRELDQAAYETNAARAEREVIACQTILQWQADKVQMGFEDEHLKAEARQLAEERNLYSVKAPVEGAVLGLEGVCEGSYVQSGQRLGEISPTSDFVIDVSVPPKDIARIATGQPVNLQVDAYPYTVWGLLPGRVIRISADYVQEGDANSAFRMMVRPEREYLQLREGLRGALKKGIGVLLYAKRCLHGRSAPLAKIKF